MKLTSIFKLVINVFDLVFNVIEGYLVCIFVSKALASVSKFDT